jgi:hypothetical protein
MTNEHNGELSNFSNDFKNLPPEKRVNVIETAKGLLKIQKKNKAAIANRLGTSEKQDRTPPEE